MNGPYSLITTAVSTELGTHPCLQGNSRALATVTAIIDGTGSIGKQNCVFKRILVKLVEEVPVRKIITRILHLGAAVGPLLAGPVASISKEHGWKYVFIMLMIADVLALLVCKCDSFSISWSGFRRGIFVL